MKYSADQETKLMTEMWSMNIKDDPYNFVKFTFPWGVKDTPLEDFEGPRKWQEKILREITTHIQRNQRLDMPEMFRLACMVNTMDAINQTWFYYYCYSKHRTTA